MPVGLRTQQTYWTALDRPDWCSGEDFTCKMRAIGVVTFNRNVAAVGVPIGVPLPLCERHYKQVEMINRESPIPIVVSQLRYNP